MIGSENWEDDFDALLHLVKEFIVAAWEVRKQKLYGNDSLPGQLPHQSSAGDRGPVTGVGGRVCKSGKSGVSHGKGEGHVVHAGVNCVCNVCGSTHSCGCVVDGNFARAAFCYSVNPGASACNAFWYVALTLTSSNLCRRHQGHASPSYLF